MKLHEDLPTNINDPEKFYGDYYSKVVRNSKSYFPMLNEASSKVITTKLADILLGYKKEKEICPSESRNISDRELAGLVMCYKIFQNL